MKNTNAIKYVFRTGCEIFTFVSVTAYVASAIFSGKLNGLIPKLDLILMLLAMSFTVAAGNLILKNNKWSNAKRLLIHLLLTATVYYLLFVLLAGHATSPSMTAAALAVFALLYLAFAVIWLVLRKASSKKENSKKSYSSIFDESN